MSVGPWSRESWGSLPWTHSGATLTSWELQGELSSRSELCGHREGASQQAVGALSPGIG
jgi:hypothetical protein